MNSFCSTAVCQFHIEWTFNYFDCPIFFPLRIKFSSILNRKLNRLSHCESMVLGMFVVGGFLVLGCGQIEQNHAFQPFYSSGGLQVGI